MLLTKVFASVFSSYRNVSIVVDHTYLDEDDGNCLFCTTCEKNRLFPNQKKRFIFLKTLLVSRAITIYSKLQFIRFLKPWMRAQAIFSAINSTPTSYPQKKLYCVLFVEKTFWHIQLLLCKAQYVIAQGSLAYHSDRAFFKLDIINIV